MAEGVQGKTKVTTEMCRFIRKKVSAGHSPRGVADHLLEIDVSQSTVAHHAYGRCACRHRMKPADKIGPGPAPRVYDGDLVEYIFNHDDPVVSTNEVEKRFNGSRQWALKRLKKLRADARIEGKDIGPGWVWWVEDFTEVDDR